MRGNAPGRHDTKRRTSRGKAQPLHWPFQRNRSQRRLLLLRFFLLWSLFEHPENLGVVATIDKKCTLIPLQPYLAHAAEQTDRVAECLQAPQHHERLLLELPLIVLVSSCDQSRPGGRGVVHHQ